MLSKARTKLVRELHTRKGREKHGLCLVEGRKNVEAAGDRVEFAFTREDTPEFDELVTTETPQDVAAVARVPEWSDADIAAQAALVVLDGVQDPGNAGAILRLCQGFNAALLLINSVDVTNPKTVRSSAGAVFAVPWRRIAASDAAAYVTRANRTVYRVERRDGPDTIVLDAKNAVSLAERAAFILGAEGTGISLDIEGASLAIPTDPTLESLNVGNAAAIVLYAHAVLSER